MIMEVPVRFTTAMTDPRPKAEKDQAAAGTDDGSMVRQAPGTGFYDDSDAKLANRQEDIQLAVAIDGISLDQFKTVAGIEQGRKTVQRGFHKIVSQQQLLDVARADNAVGPRHRSPGDTPHPNRQPSPQRQASRKNMQLPSPPSPRQHLYLSPSMPSFSPKSPDPRRSRDGFHGSRPLTSGGRRATGAQGGGRVELRPSSGTSLTSVPYRDGTGITRARTAHGVRQIGHSRSVSQASLTQNHGRVVQTTDNQSQLIQTGSIQCKPVQASSIQQSADDADTTNDRIAPKQYHGRRRSNSAFSIDQIRPPPSSHPDGSTDPLTDPKTRLRSNSNQNRPHTAYNLHSRSRRELARLTHIDAITAAELALRRKLWMARQESKHHVGDVALQEKVQEFLNKLDQDKKKRMQPSILIDSRDKTAEEHLVLPAV